MLPADPPIDLQLVSLACAMAKCEPDHLLGARWANDTLTVVVQPPPLVNGHAPKPRTEVFTAAQIAAAVAGSMTIAIAAGLHPTPPADWYQKNVVAAQARQASAPAGQTRESFQDAVRADPDMTPAAKERWLGTPAPAPTAPAPLPSPGGRGAGGEGEPPVEEPRHPIVYHYEESGRALDELNQPAAPSDPESQFAADMKELQADDDEPQVHRVETGKPSTRHRGKHT
jgi:hypothetical protein